MRGRLVLGLAAAALAAACDQLPRLGPAKADSAIPTPAAPTSPDIRPLAGAAYPELAAAEARFSAQGLGLTEAATARFEAAMAHPAQSWLLAGGGAEALVFTGCAAEGCQEGFAVVAIDLERAGAFVGVRDAAGASPLVANPRVEALLRLNSPTRAWDDLSPPPPAPASRR